MSNNTLPQKIDFARSVTRGSELKGFLVLSEMDRLCSSLSSTEGQVEVHLRFGKDEQKINIVRGQVKAKLCLQCQRCMETFNYLVNESFIASMIHHEEEAKLLPDEYDPLLLTDGILNIKDMIEDILIVSLPVVPMHDEAVCQAKLPYETGISENENNPFKVIEILRSKDSTKN